MHVPKGRPPLLLAIASYAWATALKCWLESVSMRSDSIVDSDSYKYLYSTLGKRVCNSAVFRLADASNVNSFI